jgi:hypothetical protein
VSALATAALTIIGGVIILAASYMIAKLVIEPINEQRRIIGEVDFALTYWVRYYASPAPFPSGVSKERDEGAETMRLLAGRLAASTNAIRLYPLAVGLGAPPREAIGDACRRLLSLSGSFYYPEGASTVEHALHSRENAYQIRDLLKLTVAGGP